MLLNVILITAFQNHKPWGFPEVKIVVATSQSRYITLLEYCLFLATRFADVCYAPKIFNSLVAV